MNKKLSAHLQYNWGWYLVILAVAVLLWTAIFSGLAQPKDYEQLRVTVFADQVDLDEFGRFLNDQKETFTKQPLKKITVDGCAGDNSSISVLAATRALSSDVIIVEEKLLQTDSEGGALVNVPGNFQPFAREELETVLGAVLESVKFYEADGKNYGIYLDETHVLFFGQESVNLAGLYGQGDREHRAALDLLLYLLEVANG